MRCCKQIPRETVRLGRTKKKRRRIGNLFEVAWILIVGAGNDAHGLFADPKLVSASPFDLHLRTDSPAIDRGQTIDVAGDEDIDGQPRVQGVAIDIGADEVR